MNFVQAVLSLGWEKRKQKESNCRQERSEGKIWTGLHYEGQNRRERVFL